MGHATTRELLGSRGEQALVWVAQDGEEYVLVVTATGQPAAPRRHRAAEVGALADRLTRDLRAHAFAGTNPALEAAVGRAVAGSVAALDHRLFADVSLSDGPVVVVPGRTLMAVPWGMLPSLAGRPVTVAPSVTRWATSPAHHAGTAVERLRVSTSQVRGWPCHGRGGAVAEVWEAVGGGERPPLGHRAGGP